MMLYRALAAAAAILVGAVTLTAAMILPVGGVVKPGPTVKIVLPGGHGSGVVLEGGFILTAAHVVKGESLITIKFDDGTTSTAVETMWVNTQYDLALLRVTEPIKAETRELVCEAPAMGDRIVATGNPIFFEFVAAPGIVTSSIQSVLTIWPQVFAFTGSLAPGMSGGPVFDEDGDVVGINVGRVPGEALFWAVPGSVACMLMGRT